MLFDKKAFSTATEEGLAAVALGPIDEQPCVVLAKEIAAKYLALMYTMNPEPPFDFDFKHVSTLWTWGRWRVVLEAEIDGVQYTVLHNGTTGEVIDMKE